MSNKELSNNNNGITKRISFDEVKYQFLAACCANIVVLGQGCAIGWISPTLPILQSDNSPLGKFTVEEASWVGSISSIGSIVGTMYFGFISIYVGSKNTLILCAFPVTIFWVFVIFASNAWHLCAGRFIMGLTAGAFLCVQLYLADIANERVRGSLGTLLTLSVNIGILIGYIGGTFLEYKTVPYVMMCFPILFIFVFLSMPNTPQYYLKSRRIGEAEKSLRFYRNCKSSTSTCDANDELLKELSVMSAIAKQNEVAGTPKLSDFFNRSTIKVMLIGPTLMAVSQFSGSFVLTNYAVTIFQRSGSDYSPHTSSIVFGCLQIAGTYVTTLFIDRVGRKVLLIISGSGCAIGLTVMGIFSYLFECGFDVSRLNWIPVVSLSFVIFIASIGLIPIPYVIIAEVLPQKIRLIGTTICTATVSIWAAIILNRFPHMLLNLELYGCMWLFASVCLLGLVFTVFFVPETKGKKLDVLAEDIECNNNNQKIATIS